MAQTRDADVVVIGAGPRRARGGPRAARRGRDVVVLEARDRVGGRTLNEPIGDGKVVEIGAQWVGPTQDRVLALIGELGLETFPTYVAGRQHLRARGQAGPVLGDDPDGPTRSASPRSGCAMKRLNRMAAQVPPEAPWRAPKAAELGLADVRDLDAPQRPHRGRPRHPAAGDHRRLGRRAARRLAASRPLLHPLGRLDRDPHRRRGRRPAGPDRRRHAADLAADGRGARPGRRSSSAHRCARSGTPTQA